MINNFVRWDELRDVAFDEDLQLLRHLADALVAEAIVPDDDFFFAVLLGILLNPLSDCFVISSSLNEGLEVIAVDFGEIKEEVVEWAIVVVVTVGCQQ